MPKRTVIISVYGGVADVDSKPDDVAVVIRDYDVESVDENGPNIFKDADGALYYENKCEARE